MKKLLTTTEGVQIVFDKTVARVSHIALSSVMGVLPQSTMKLIKRYESTLSEHGLLGFKIQVIKGRGQPEQVAWLNENQCYFILTLSRNTDKVVQAKSNLIKAFSAARELLAQRATQYLPPIFFGSYPIARWRLEAAQSTFFIAYNQWLCYYATNLLRDRL